MRAKTAPAARAGKSSSAKVGKQTPQSAMIEKVASSCLNDKDAKKLQFEPLTAEQVKTKMPFLPAHVTGFRIPYFDISGKPSKFWRFRYLEDTRTGLDKQTNKKPLRYSQAPKTLNELYLPPLGVDWKALAKDPTIALTITEGELKAACATKFGFPTIGLGGVWCFRSAREFAPLLPGFAEFNWKGRRVSIVYDSDAATNPEVLKAENALARELAQAGAEPCVIRMPPLPDGRKCGLDDYANEHGPDGLKTLLESGEPWRAAQELHLLNEEVVYVRDPGVVLRLDTLQRIAPRAFVDHAYSTRIYYEQQTTDKGTKLVEKCAPKEWLRWPQRSEVQSVTYAPGQPRVTDSGGRTQLNVWPGWACEPQKGDVSLWNELLTFLFRSDPQHRQWFERWLAYPLQHPGEKMYSAAVLWGGEHGTGKSLVGYTMFRLYGANATEIEDRNLQESHNEWAENKQFVLADEITGGDKRGIADRLKGIITRLQLRLNPKYVPSYTVPDCINYYFTSNHPDSFFIEDKDRRYFVHEVSGAPLPDEFYKRYDAALKDPEQKFAKALFHYLLMLPMGDFNAKSRAPLTKAKQEMIENGRSDLGSWVAQLRDDPDSVLRLDGNIIRYDLWRSEELLNLYDPERRGRVTVNGMSRELRRSGMPRANGGMPCITAAGQARLWSVRGQEKYVGLAGTAVGQLYNKERNVVDPTVKSKKAKY